jgi:hypothetical protein
MKKPTNNVEFLTNFMEWGSPMNQMFVIDAVSKLAKSVVDNEASVLKSMENNFIHGPAWVQCAKDFVKQSEEFYNRFNSPIEEEEERPAPRKRVELETTVLYATIRLEVNHPRYEDVEDVIESISSSADYEISYDESNVAIVNTELVEVTSQHP